MSSSETEEMPAAASPVYDGGPAKPLVKNLTLTWSGEGLRFDGRPEGVPPSVVDGGTKAGPSPMDHLLLALAGCMSSDVIDILKKGRVPIEHFQVEVVGERAPNPPRRFTR